MKKLAIHFQNNENEIVDNVTTYWQNAEYWHVRTLFGNCPEERQYDRKKIIAIFEVLNDEQRRII